VDEADDGAEAPLISSTDLIRFTRSSGGSDRRRGLVGERGLLHRLVGIAERLRAGPLQCADDVLVVMAQQALAGFGTCLFAGLGDMPAQENAPVLPVDRLAVLGGGGCGKAPLRRQGVEGLRSTSIRSR